MSPALDRPASIWTPLGRHPAFRSLWLASVVSNVGTWMQNVGAMWLMASLSPSPLLVGLVQTATSLPAFLLALPAGALADVVDRRRLLLITQAWMLVAAVVLGILTLAGRATPGMLLALTFAIGLGAAMTGPAWQAIMPELVPRAELPAAVALNGVAVNIARAVGPALGGLVLAQANAGVVFLVNAASFLGVMLALVAWRRAVQPGRLPPEHVLGAMRAGLRYVRYRQTLQAVLVRAGAFTLCGISVLALLPLVARDHLGLGAGGFGALLGFFGAGAIAGAAVLPRLRQRLGPDRLVSAGTLAFSAATAALAWTHGTVVASAAVLVAGIAWMAVMASFNVAAQVGAASWVQARALGTYMLVFQGGMAAGSALWGAMADHVGTAQALVGSAVGLVVGLVVLRGWGVGAAEAADLTPSRHWAEPAVAVEPAPDDGPVLVTLAYRIDPARAAEFHAAMRALGRVRRRDGAFRWRLFRDPGDPARYLECFLVNSWAEHLRQHERVTVADRRVEDRARAFHVGDSPPVVSHFIDAAALRD